MFITTSMHFFVSKKSYTMVGANIESNNGGKTWELTHVGRGHNVLAPFNLKCLRQKIIEQIEYARAMPQNSIIYRVRVHDTPINAISPMYLNEKYLHRQFGEGPRFRVHYSFQGIPVDTNSLTPIELEALEQVDKAECFLKAIDSLKHRLIYEFHLSEAQAEEQLITCDKSAEKKEQDRVLHINLSKSENAFIEHEDASLQAS